MTQGPATINEQDNNANLRMTAAYLEWRRTGDLSAIQNIIHDREYMDQLSTKSVVDYGRLLLSGVLTAESNKDILDILAPPDHPKANEILQGLLQLYDIWTYRGSVPHLLKRLRQSNLVSVPQILSELMERALDEISEKTRALDTVFHLIDEHGMQDWKKQYNDLLPDEPLILYGLQQFKLQSWRTPGSTSYNTLKNNLRMFLDRLIDRKIDLNGHQTTFKGRVIVNHLHAIAIAHDESPEDSMALVIHALLDRGADVNSVLPHLDELSPNTVALLAEHPATKRAILLQQANKAQTAQRPDVGRPKL